MTQTVTFTQKAVVVPPTFDATTILNDGPMVPSPVSGPTKMAIAPDGRIFIAEHWGGVRIVKNDVVLPTAFLRIPAANIDTTGSRGLMGITLDPSFAINGFVYLHYTRKIPNLPSKNRISRFKASTANPDLADVDGTGAPVEVLLFEMTAQGSANAHNSMPMLFGTDGKLWVTTGENNVPANAQNTQHSGGKILRMNPDGSPAAGNPMLSSANQVEKRLWAKGLRNPWTLAIDPLPGGTGRIFFNDVGSLEGGTPDTAGQPWEELNSVPLTTTALLDYGWPNKEGLGPNIVYRYANGPGNDGADCAIVGGAFYRSSGATYSFPASFNGAYFFGDHCSGWIRYLPAGEQVPNTTGTAPSGNDPVGFATELGAALLDLQVHPDGSLYYIARATVARDHDAPGVIGRIRPTSVAVPTARITDPSDGATFDAPTSFVVTAEATTAAGTITKVEFFSDGAKLGEDTTAPYSFAMNNLGQGDYRLTVKATNSVGGVKESDAVTVVVGGPTAVILSPAAGATYVAGQPVSFSGSASDDEDGTLPASALEWNVLLHHNSHTHPAAGPFPGASGSFTPNPDDETDHDVKYVLYLTATDSAGLKHTATRELLPIKSNITLAAAPAAAAGAPGMKVWLDGSPQTPPYTFLGAGGVNRSIEASACVTVPATGTSPTFYGFQAWSQGGPIAQIIGTPTAPATFTASYTTGPWLTADIGAAGGGYGAAGSPGGNCAFTLNAAGADIWGTGDQMRYVYRQVSGDVTITARVTNLCGTAACPHAWVKAAVMVRQSTAPGSRHVSSVVSPTAANKFRLVVRPTDNASTTSTPSTPSSQVPAWLRVVRTGNSLVASYSLDGITFTPVGAPQNVTMTNPVLVGLGLTSHNTATATTAVFENVTVVGPAPPAPPNAPTNLTASGGVNQVQLNWINNGGGDTGVKVERKPQSQADTSYALVATTPAGANSYLNTMVPAGSYTYRVRATNAAGDSGNSNPANAVATDPAPTAPAAPSGLVAGDGVGQTTLVWTDNANNETAFRIERKLASDGVGSFAEISTVGANVTSFTDAALAVGSYSYRVRASNAVGNSGYSNSDDAASTTQPAGPAAPTNLAAAVANGTAVTLTWTDNASNETGFRVEKKTGTASFVAITPDKAANVTTHVDSGLAAGTYTYRVTALGSPNSAASGEVIVVLGSAQADAYVRSGTSAGTNFGTAAMLELKTTTTTTTKRNTFLRFSLEGVGNTVVSAKLRMFGRAQTSAKATSVYSVADTTWIESGTGGITWNTPTTDAGGPAMGASALATQTVAIVTGTITETTGAWYEFDVTSYIQQRKTAGATLVSLGVKSGVLSDEGQSSFNARNATANKPVLVITSKN